MFARRFGAAVNMAVVAVVLAACGGGTLGEGDGGNGGSDPGGGGNEGVIESLSLTLGDTNPRVGDTLTAVFELSGSTDAVVSGVPVELEVSQTGQTETAESDAQGRGSVSLQMPDQPGEIEVVARAANGLVARQTVRVRPQVAQSIELAAFPNEIAPSRETSVRITVRDGQDNPVPGTEVRLESDDNGLVNGTPSRTLTTDDSGSIVVPVSSETSSDIQLSAQVLPSGPTDNLTVSVNADALSPENLQLSVGDTSPRVGDSLAVTANVAFADGQAAANMDVAFNVQPQGAGASARTDSEGRASTELQMPSQSGQVEIVASVGGLVERIAIDVRPDLPATLELAAFPATIGPGQQTSIRSRVSDANGNPVPNIDIRLQSDDNGRVDGSQTTTVTTDANGAAVIPVESTTDTDIALTAQVVPDGPQDSLTIVVDENATEVDSVSLSVGNSSPRVGESVSVFADVTQVGGDPAAGIDVAFSLEPTGQTVTARTNSSGRASAELQMPDQSGEVTVRIDAAGLTETQEIEVGAGESDAIELVAFPSTIAPGEETSVRAIIRDANGNPVSDTEVRFETDNDGQIGDGTIETVTTDGGGSAVVQVQSVTEEEITVTAQALPSGPSASFNVTVEDQSVAGIVLLASSAQLASSAIDAEDGVELTAIATDSANRVVQGVDIDFSASPDGALVLVESETDQNGRASAVLTTGGNARNRTVTVTASGGGAQAEQEIDIVGTRLEVSGPSAIRPNAQGSFNLRLRDAANSGIRGQRIDVSSENGNPISPPSVDTQADGTATVDVTASAAGEDTLRFDGFGLTEELSFLVSRFDISYLQPSDAIEVGLGNPVTVEVELTEQGTPVVNETVEFATTRGTLSSLNQQTDAQGRASVTLNSQSSDGAGPALLTARGPEEVSRDQQIELVSTAPSSISLQSEPATLSPDEESTLTARVTDQDGNPVKNQTVRFRVEDNSAGELTAGIATTDGQGIARTVYRPSDNGSETESVQVTASVGDPEIDQDQVALTVRSGALFIVLGSDNQISKNGDDATYSKIYNAIITDSAGNPPPENTEFRLTLRSLEYQKGNYVRGAERWIQTPTIDSSDPFFGTPNPDPARDFGPYFGQGPFGCRSEDPLGSGDINRSDDYNGNGVIDPPAIASVPNTADIDEDGVASFEVRWAQSVAQWALVRLSVTARVDGTESTRRLDFALPVAAQDVNDLDVTPPNLNSPFGDAGQCIDPS